MFIADFSFKLKIKRSASYSIKRKSKKKELNSVPSCQTLPEARQVQSRARKSSKDCTPKLLKPVNFRAETMSTEITR